MYEDEYELTFDTPEEEPVYEPEKASAAPAPVPETTPAEIVPDEPTRVLEPRRAAPAEPAEPTPVSEPEPAEEPQPQSAAVPANGRTVLISGGDRGIGAAAARAFYAAGYRVAVLCGGYLIYASSLARCDWPEGSEDLSNITHGLKNAYTMLGALMGFLIVYIADEKKLHFDVRAPFWGQVLKLVLGLALIVGIKAGLKPLLVSLFAGSQAESFVRYFLLVLFAGIVWPLTFPFFAKLGRKGNAA